MKVSTAFEMRNIDRVCMEEIGLPGIALMENAGSSIAIAALEMLRESNGKSVSVVAGRGNNGGDGFVVARHLANYGVRVKVFLLAEKEKISGDAKTNLEVLERIDLSPKEITSEEELEQIRSSLVHSDLIIDALLGTGIKGEVRGLFAPAIKLINEMPRPVLSVDIPSGLDTDRGSPLGVCVKADRTVTLGLPKRGLVVYPGASYVGKLSIAHIGIPAKLLNSEEIKVELVDEEMVRSIIPTRADDAHKGSCGRVLVVAGSVGLTGAAAMASTAALRSGAGLVTLALPESLNDLMEVKVTEVMTYPLPETSSRSLSYKALDKIMNLADKSSVLALGPGLSTAEDTVKLVQELVQRINLPLVIDADGLNAFAGRRDLLKRIKAPLVLTPHPGELSRIIEIDISEILADRIEIGRNTAEELSATLVLKVPRTITATPEGKAFINPTGNSGMATGGTGDVLTGIIAGLIAQGVNPTSAAIAGVYIHGLAGDLAACEKGKLGMIAGDLLEKVPEAINGLETFSIS